MNITKFQDALRMRQAAVAEFERARIEFYNSELCAGPEREIRERVSALKQVIRNVAAKEGSELSPDLKKVLDIQFTKDTDAVQILSEVFGTRYGLLFASDRDQAVWVRGEMSKQRERELSNLLAQQTERENAAKKALKKAQGELVEIVSEGSGYRNSIQKVRELRKRRAEKK